MKILPDNVQKHAATTQARAWPGPNVVRKALEGVRGEARHSRKAIAWAVGEALSWFAAA